jgi:hypothetical protein
MKKAWFLVGFCMACCCGQAMAEPQTASAKATSDAEMSVDAISQELSNPLGRIWSLTAELQSQKIDGTAFASEQSAEVFIFQPTLPITLKNGDVWIHRPVVTYLNNMPYFDADTGQQKDFTGLGDMQYLGLYGKTLLTEAGDKQVWGWGITTILPTAEQDEVGQEQWAAGPAAVYAALGDPFEFTYGLLAQHWWKVAGEDEREEINQTALQPIYVYNLPGGWTVGGAPTITANWSADEDNRWTVPLEFGVNKVFKIGGKLPLRIGVAYVHTLDQPDDGGLENYWTIKLKPVVPSWFGLK